MVGCSCSCGRTMTVLVGLAAVLIGLFASGALTALGVFRFIDGVDPLGRGPFFKGMAPLLHQGIEWGFTLDKMPDLTGETVFVTGGNVGLGYWTARHLSASKAHVIIGCRSTAKCNAAAAAIGKETGVAVETAELDLASFASIKSCATALVEKHPRLDSLILNAGVMIPPFTRTKEGLELQIGVNHFGHALLTKLLLAPLEAAAQAAGVATVAVVSSAAHFDSYPEGILPTVEAMNDEAAYMRPKAYGQSKLANVLFAQELSSRWADKNILVNAIHPGAVDTDLTRHMLEFVAWFSPALALRLGDTLIPLVTWHPREASLTQLYAAVGPEVRAGKVTGKYFHPIARETNPDQIHATNATLQKMLWAMTEDFIAART